MDPFIEKIIEMAPAVAILLFLVIRQDRRSEKLVDELVECFRERDDAE